MRYEPRAEDYAGDNNAYRGVESHGVAKTVDPIDVSGYDGTVPVVYDQPAPEPVPVPVRIVSESARERKMWRVNRYLVNSVAPVRVVNALETRTDLHIHNAGPNDVFLSPESHSATEGFGFPVAAGGSLSLNSEESVWGSVRNGESAELRILTEYTVEI
jgi:hypothetical protein